MLGEVVSSDLRWSWPGPGWVGALAGAAAVLWILTLYAREQAFVSLKVRMILAALRLAALAIIAAMLLEPMASRQRVVRPRLVVLADRSASMTNSDAADAQSSRLEAWKRVLTGGAAPLIDQLGREFDVDVVTFDATPTRLADQPIQEAIAAVKPAEEDGGGATRLGDAIVFALRQLAGPRPAAVIVMSDGIVTQGLSLADAAARARGLGTPIFAIGIGSDRPPSDVAVDDVLVESAAFPGDRLDVEAAVRSVGFENRTARVTLSDAASSRMIAETDVALPADGETRSVRLSLRAGEPGARRLQVSIAPQSEEKNLENNRRDAVVDIQARPIRVLLAASQPSFEYRALKSLLERDPAMDVHVHLQTADPDYAAVDQAAVPDFPVSEAELLEYDVVLLDDLDPEAVPASAWSSLLNFVSKEGGGVVLVAGPRRLPAAYRDIDAMRTLLPIELADNPLSPTQGAGSAFAVIPTALGRSDLSLQLGETAEQSAAIWKELPRMWWLFEDYAAKPGAEVLAERLADDAGAGRPAPIILRHRVGAGEVLMHATDESWRWRWRSDDRYFARYWGQAVRRLARGRVLRGGPTIATSRSEYRVGDPVIMRARLRSAGSSAADGAEVRLESLGQPTREVRLAKLWSQTDAFEATLRDLPAGEYSAQLVHDDGGAAPSPARFSVLSPRGEMARRTADSAGLAEAARMSGGKYYDLTSWPRLKDELPPPRPVAVEQLPDRPLWNIHVLLTMLCVALAAEWLLRRRSGML